VVIWLHISILDLFFITYNGPVFLWRDNSQLPTIIVHFSIALATTILFKIIAKARIAKLQKNKLQQKSQQVSKQSS
jgi:hypothetical protein